jgi:hypothetical protein
MRRAASCNGVLDSVSDCSDGEGNDGNGLTDFPADPGCNSLADPEERPAVPSVGPLRILSVAPLLASAHRLVERGYQRWVASARVD